MRREAVQGYSEAEKLKLLYADSLEDIRELMERIEAVRISIVEASRAAGEAQLLAFDRNEMQLQNYAQALAKFTNDHAERLSALTQQQIGALQGAGETEQKKFLGYTGSLRNNLVRDLGATLTKIVETELGKVNAIVHEFGPALAGYSSRIAQLVSDLDRYENRAAGLVQDASKGASAEAAKQLATATTGHMGRLYAQLWVFCGVSALVGGFVATAVHVLWK